MAQASGERGERRDRLATAAPETGLGLPRLELIVRTTIAHVRVDLRVEPPVGVDGRLGTSEQPRSHRIRGRTGGLLLFDRSEAGAAERLLVLLSLIVGQQSWWGTPAPQRRQVALGLGVTAGLTPCDSQSGWVLAVALVSARLLLIVAPLLLTIAGLDLTAHVVRLSP
jgi:hypothetical protein